MSGGSTQCILGEIARLGEDGVLDELCDILKRGGCKWLEDEVPGGCISREDLCRQPETHKKTPSNEPLRDRMEAVGTMQRMRESGGGRGYGPRDDSLHQLWYDPSQTSAGDCFFEYDIRSTKEWTIKKDPLLLSCSIFPIHIDGYASINKSSDLRRGAARFASSMRWFKKYKRRYSGKSSAKNKAISKI